MGNVPRSTPGSFALTLDGTQCGFVKSVDGGEITADVISEPADGGVVKKHIGQPKYEEFELRLGLAMARDVSDWIRDSWAANPVRKSGSVVAVDANLNAKSERQFVEALITETTLPALDAASKEPGLVTLKFAPELIKNVKVSGKVQGSVSKKQKQFLPSNFRFELDGLDCKKVTKIDSFTVKQQVVTNDIGERRIAERVPGRLEFPNLRVTMVEGNDQTWADWFEDFVVKGNNGDDKEKSGAIVFLSADDKNELGRVTLENVGIFALRREPVTDGQLARLVAELYCEQMEFTVKAGPDS
jgi:hypothetical protein